MGDVENLVHVREQDTILRLEAMLEASLNSLTSGGVRTKGLGLGCPHELGADVLSVQGHHFSGAGRAFSGVRDGVPDLSTLLDIAAHRPTGERVERLKKARVHTFSDPANQQGLAPSKPVLNWLNFETILGKEQFCLHNGRWYRLNAEYADHHRSPHQGDRTVRPVAR